MRKAVAKSASAKKAAAKAPKASKKMTVRGKAISDRAAEVEENLGGSRPLRDFLNSIGWS
jgi:hypothetical protein